MPVVCKGCQEILTLCRCTPDQREMFFRERRQMAQEASAAVDLGRHTKPSSRTATCPDCGQATTLCGCRKKQR